ncbi:restriction endonuclease subunit S [Petrimonas sulfuriphila]|uniref:restriction endonuclease subunit S n=1 Tax=Petrimonas sulfuriphila TaxID=285070 RepID=UPI003249FDF4
MGEKNNIPQIRFNGFDESWEVKKLGEIGFTYSGLFGKSKIDFGHGEGKYITYMNIFSNPITNVDITAPIEIDINQNEVEFGDVFFTTSSETPEEVGMTSVWLGSGKNTYLNSFCFGYRLTEELDSYFIAYLLRSFNTRKKITYLAQGISRYNISKNKVMQICISRPKISEQYHIGSYFQNLDKLITLQQQKHDKLVTLKKAMLDKMFPTEGADVPEIRFMGFTGDWDEEKLGDIGYTYTGLTGKTKADFGHGNGKYITYMNVFSNPVADNDITEAIEVDNNQNKVQFGDVFFTTSSETPEEVGMSSVWLKNCHNTYLNSFCFGYRPNIKVDNYYFAYLLRSTVIRKRIIFLAQGISRYNISKNKVMEISVPLPNLEEQKQIGSYFQNLDKLISLHQQEIQKLKNIKKACLEKMFV